MLKCYHKNPSKFDSGHKVKNRVKNRGFEDENEYEYQIKLNVFARVLEKRHPGKLHFTFFPPRKLGWLFMPKEIKPTPYSTIIKLLTFDILFSPL